MTVGKAPHVILGQEMLKPRDGAEKDEGELTGGKRLVEQLRKRQGHFADVIVADALYLNAPFINTCLLYTSPSPRDSCASRMPSSA